MTVLAVSLLDRQCQYAGERFPLDDLPPRLADRRGHWRREHERIPRSIVATDDPGGLLGLLDTRFGRRNAPGSYFWQWSLTLRPASIWLARHDESAYTALTPHLSLFGWARRRGTHEHPSKTSRYYPVLDVLGWREAAEILDGYPGELVEQISRFALDLAAWCESNRLGAALTPAAIGSRLLRDKRFWPARVERKIPAATNRRARGHLPGNLYRIVIPQPARASMTDERFGKHQGTGAGPTTDVHVRGPVLELDITGAHHWAAIHLRPPAARSLFAWGRFYEPARGLPRDLIPLSDLRHEHGLLLCAVESWNRLDPLSHPAAAHQGVRWRYLWTSELPALETPGIQVLGAKAGWTSDEIDEGLCELAYWAAMQLQNAPADRRRWLKQPLLSAYGLLAARPRPFVQMSRWSPGEPATVTFPGGQTVHGYKRQTEPREPRTANVIWRGMIEAWVRAEILTQARQLRDQGWRIVSLYADSIYVLDQPDRVPELRAGWRIAQTLHNMRLQTATHFRSDEIDKLPGIPREKRAA